LIKLGERLRVTVAAARRAAFVAAILSIGACGGGIEGPPANMENLSADPIARANLQTRYIEGLRLSADLPQYPATQPASADDWRLIQRAGIDQIDEACNNYLYTLYRFNAQQKAARQGLLAATATTGVIMGLAGAGTMAIGIAAAALGLSAALFEASTNSVLFSVEASAVRNVVQESRSRFATVMAANPPTTRPDTMIALRGYLSLCTPAVIEANINNSANGSRNSVVTPDEKAGVAAAALAAPALAPPRLPRVAMLDSATAPIPLLPTPPRATGVGPREPIGSQDVRDLQVTLCVAPPTGEVGPLTRTAVGNYLSAINNGADPPLNVNIAVGKDATQLREAVEKARASGPLKTCAERGYLNAFEVGLIERANDIPGRITLLQEDINKKLEAGEQIKPDGTLGTLRILVGKLRKDAKAQAIDLQLYREVTGLK
jgi:hypothetical protein